MSASRGLDVTDMADAVRIAGLVSFPRLRRSLLRFPDTELSLRTSGSKAIGFSFPLPLSFSFSASSRAVEGLGVSSLWGPSAVLARSFSSLLAASARSLASHGRVRLQRCLRRHTTVSTTASRATKQLAVAFEDMCEWVISELAVGVEGYGCLEGPGAEAADRGSIA